MPPDSSEFEGQFFIQSRAALIYIFKQVRLHLNVKLFNEIRMTGFVVRLFSII